MENKHKFLLICCKILLLSVFITFIGCTNYLSEIKESVEDKDVSYRVEHYLQTADGTDWVVDSSASQALMGMSHSMSVATSKSYDGFTARKVEQQIIKRDGSTIVKIFYDRNIITYTFKLNGGVWNESGEDAIVKGLYGSTFAYPESPSRSGYDFVGWDADIPETFEAQNKCFTAKWVAGNETHYKVEHLFQDTDGNNYVKMEDSVQNLIGTTGDFTDAKSNDYVGFTARDIIQKEIAADGSTVVQVFYDRTTVTYTFYAGEGRFSDGSTTKTVSGLFGSTVLINDQPIRNGYTFDWNNDVPEFFGSSDALFTANWSANIGVKYKVEHLMQNIEDDDYALLISEEKKGATDSQTEAVAKTYEGFTAQVVNQKAISADENTVIQIKYDRNTITYIFNSVDGFFSDGTSSKIVNGRYGAQVTKPVNPSRIGYTFNGWNLAVPLIFGKDNAIFQATWTANSDTQYKVEHWQQNANDDEYTKIEEEIKYGTTATQTNAVAKTYEGFTAQTINQSEIKATDVTVIKVYYNRDIINYKFDAGNGVFSDNSTIKTVSGRYGAIVNFSYTPTRNGYDFNSWDTEIPISFGKESKVFHAIWTPLGSVSLSFISGTDIVITQNEYTFTATLESGDIQINSYEWYFDGVKQSSTSNTLTLSIENLYRGYYELIVKGIDSYGIQYISSYQVAVGI